MIFDKHDKVVIKRILGLLKPYTKKITISLLCIIASAGISMLFPLFSRELTDNGLLAKNFSVVIKYALFSFSLVLINQAIGLLETKYYSYINSIFQYSLSKTAFKHTLKLKLHYFSNTNFAETMNNIGMDVGNISRICDRGTFIIVSQVFRIVGGVIGLLIIDWKLTFVVLCIIPIRYYTVKFIAKKRKQMFEEFMEYNREFYAWYGDIIGGVKEVKLWGIDRIMTGQFIKKQRKIVKMNIKMAFLDKFNEYSESIMFQAITNALYILGAYMVFNNGLSIGSLFAFLTYSAYVTGPISAILNIGYSFSDILPSAKRFFEFMDMETELDNSHGKLVRVDKKQMNGRITFENVSFSYKEGEPILNRVNFDIKPGEKIAIIGANGSGKSTLTNLLLRFYKPDNGRILIDGIDVKDVKLRDYRQLISVVSQDLYLFNTTVEDNIAVLPKVHKAKIFKAAKESGAQDFIEEMPMKYKSEVGRNGSKLSGGQRQKIAVARAFARDAKILILDEATSNYDAASEAYVNELLSKNFKDMTVIIISHKPDILKKADRVLKLDNCNVVEYDNCFEEEEKSAV